MVRALLLPIAMGTTVVEETLSEKELSSHFAAFKSQFERRYASSEEETLRFANFRASLHRIQAHNANPARTWDMGLNQFSDLTDEEFAQRTLMAPQTCSATHNLGAEPRPPISDKELSSLPDRFDWRETPGIISEVKNQGHCGSCWTFSSTGCLEAHAALKFGSWHRSLLSEQQLVDCAQAFDNNGCKGGLPSHAFEYIRYAGGLDTEFNYQYTAKDGNCTFNASTARDPFLPRSAGVGVQVPGGSVNLTVGDEQSLKYHIATTGPVSIAYQVVKDFRDYKGGVYTSKACNNTPADVNHAVLAIGYGTDPDSGLDYWLVKNSWDYTFGVEGYFKIEAFKNMCGVADCMAFPDLYGDESTHSSPTFVV